MSTPRPDILREAKKGSAELVILSLLADQARHGYELAARIEAESGGALSFNFASLYATLYQLEGRGWIQGRWVERAGQPDMVLPPGAVAVGRTIGELGMDEGKVVVTALRREGIIGRDPEPGTRLREGDVLVLWGAPEDLEQGENRLLMG